MPMRLLRGLSGRVLACGCLVGLYETYDGDVVATIDVRGKKCGTPQHRLHAEIPVEHLEDGEAIARVTQPGATA